MSSPSEPRTIGVGLISVGWMGRLHSRAYTAMPAIYPELGIHPRLVQAADTAPASRDYAQNVLGYETTTADYHEVLANPEVDVVSICAPNFLHAEIGIAAARAGKPFWVEKPVGRGGTETAAVAAAAQKAGVATGIGFNYRHVPAVQLAKKMIAEGQLGRITNVRGRFFGGFSSNPDDPLAWRFVRAQSGSGVLGDLMGHLVDLVHYVLGPISEVTATTGTFITERPPLPGVVTDGAESAGAASTTLLPVENEDYANMLIRLHDSALAAGALGTLEASRIAVGSSSDYSIEINGTEGALRWNFTRMNELDVALGRGGPLIGFTTVLANGHFPEFSRFQPSAGTGMGYDDLKTIEAMKFLSAVVGGPAESSNIQDALASAQVLDAAEASAASGLWVTVPIVEGSTAAIR